MVLALATQFILLNPTKYLHFNPNRILLSGGGYYLLHYLEQF
jgi:hypothetical protein